MLSNSEVLAEIRARGHPGPRMPADVVLLGPPAAGKSTLADLVAGRLDVPVIAFDRHMIAQGYADFGADPDHARRLRHDEGYRAEYAYWKPFYAASVESLLLARLVAPDVPPRCVFDLGAMHSTYEDDALRARVREALRPYPNSFLVLPSPDRRDSLRILRRRDHDRRGCKWAEDGWDLVEHFATFHHANRDLAKHVVYTEGRTPAEACDEIMAMAEPSASQESLYASGAAEAPSVGAGAAGRATGLPGAEDRR